MKAEVEVQEYPVEGFPPGVPEFVTGRRVSRGRLARRMTRTFVLVAGVLLLGMGLVLTWVSYDAQLGQVRVRQQKTAREAALMTTAYLTRARETLTSYGCSLISN